VPKFQIAASTTVSNNPRTKTWRNRLLAVSPGPFIFLQTPTKVIIVEESSQHIYVNVPHSENPKPSGFGQSIGRYEGDTPVVDTISLFIARRAGRAAAAAT
jgi:hypothetical protein